MKRQLHQRNGKRIVTQEDITDRHGDTTTRYYGRHCKMGSERKRDYRAIVRDPGDYVGTHRVSQQQAL